MGRSKKQLIPLLIAVLLLAGLLVVLLRFPQTLPWLPGNEPSDPPHPDDPSDPSDPDDPTDPTDPSNPDDPINPDDPSHGDDPQSIVRREGEFYTYEDMESDLAALQEKYSAHFAYESFGTSVDGRALYVAYLGNRNAGKQVIITAGMHAREYVNCYVIMQQMEYYLSEYDTLTYREVAWNELLSDVCFVVVPMCNPDGVAMAQGGVGALRSEQLRESVRAIAIREMKDENGDVDAYVRKYWKSNARGVDINRNFDALWSDHLDGAGRPSSKNFKGQMAASEPETAALVSLTKSLSNPVYSLCIHHRGEIIYWRCDTPGTYSQTGKLLEENRALAELVRQITKYPLDPDDQSEPSYSNWTIVEMGIPTITVETGSVRYTYPQTYAMRDEVYDDLLNVWAEVAYRLRG